MAALQGPSRAQAAQALDFALEPKGSPCTRALGVARLVAGGHTAHAYYGATHCGSASYEHAAGHAARRRRQTGSGHIGGSAPCTPPLRGARSPARRRTRGACAVYVQYICVCVPVHCQYTASTRAHAARLLCGSQPIITLVAALAVTRVAWAMVRATGGRSEVAGARCTRVQPPAPPCVAKGCRFQAKGCRLQPPLFRGVASCRGGSPRVAHRRWWPRSSPWPAWATSRAAPPCPHRGRGYAECLTPS